MFVYFDINSKNFKFVFKLGENYKMFAYSLNNLHKLTFKFIP